MDAIPVRGCEGSTELCRPSPPVPRPVRTDHEPFWVVISTGSRPSLTVCASPARAVGLGTWVHGYMGTEIRGYMGTYLWRRRGLGCTWIGGDGRYVPTVSCSRVT